MQSEPIQAEKPFLLFAVISLTKGSGGIAEWSRQIFQTLVSWYQEEKIQLEVHVLEGSSPDDNDELLAQPGLPAIAWHAGVRRKFTLALLGSKSHIHLMDHVGLARVPSLIPRRMRKPYILMIHGVEIWKSNRSDYARAARKAESLIANSEYTARKSREKYPGLPEIDVCWPGKDLEVHIIDDVEKSLKLVPSGSLKLEEIEVGPHAMLIIGRLSAEQKHKGHDQLIEAMPSIIRNVPGAQLVIVGSGSDLSRLRQKASDLELENQVIFTGWMGEEQLSTLYTKCALFVMPSEGDGFGLVFLEAMKHKMPCVGLQNAAAAEVFESNVSGFLVDRDDASAMAEQLSRLLQDKERRNEIGRAGFNRYQALFTGEQFSRRFKLILAEQIAASTNKTISVHGGELNTNGLEIRS